MGPLLGGLVCVRITVARQARVRHHGVCHRDPAVKGPAVKGPAVKGPAVKGPAVKGPAGPVCDHETDPIFFPAPVSISHQVAQRFPDRDCFVIDDGSSRPGVDEHLERFATSQGAAGSRQAGHAPAPFGMKAARVPSAPALSVRFRGW